MTCSACGNADPTLIEVTDRGDVYCVVCARVTVTRAAARLPRRVAEAGEARVGGLPGSHSGSEDRPMFRRCGGLALILCLLPTIGAAQTVINPRFVEFVPSADHTVTLPDGSPMVERYEVRWYVQGAGAPVTTVGLGKPNPSGAGVIRLSLVDPVNLLAGVPVNPQVRYVARVAALGVTGEGESTDSNPFVLAAGPKPPTTITVTKQ